MLYFVLIIGMFLAFFMKNQRLSARIYTGILMVLASFRYGIGADYFAYQYLYAQLYPNVVSELLYGYEKQEAGFRALGSLVKSFGASYQIYLAVLAVMTLYFIYRISVEYSENPTLSLVVYYAFFYFVWVYSGLRQGLAMSVGVYFLLRAMDKNKNYSFIMVSVLLFTIHTSSAVLLLLYFVVTKFEWTRKRLILVLMGSLGIAFIPFGLLVDSLSDSISFLQRLLPYLDEVFTWRDLLGFQILARLFFIGLILFYYDRLCNKSSFLRKIVNLYLLSFAFYFALQFSELTAARISVYGRLLEIILLPMILTLKMQKLEGRVYLAGLLLLLSLYFVKEVNTMWFQSGLVLDNSPFVEYISVFNKGDQYYNTYFYYILYYGATKSTPMNFHMIQ